MTADFLFRLLLGHFVGDYLLQNNFLALNKKKDIAVAGIHCLIWTISVFIFILPELTHWVDGYVIIPSHPQPVHDAFFRFYIIAFLLFISHFIFDATDLLERYFQLIRGRSYKIAKEYIERKDVTDEQRGYMLAYTALVQTVADNTLHLLCIYAIIRLLGVV